MIVEQIRTRVQNPEESGWYDTDRGNLYWWKCHKDWSCSDGALSVEYPKYWYSPVGVVDLTPESSKGLLVAVGASEEFRGAEKSSIVEFIKNMGFKIPRDYHPHIEMLKKQEKGIKFGRRPSKY